MLGSAVTLPTGPPLARWLPGGCACAGGMERDALANKAVSADHTTCSAYWVAALSKDRNDLDRWRLACGNGWAECCGTKGARYHQPGSLRRPLRRSAANGPAFFKTGMLSVGPVAFRRVSSCRPASHDYFLPTKVIHLAKHIKRCGVTLQRQRIASHLTLHCAM